MKSYLLAVTLILILVGGIRHWFFQDARQESLSTYPNPGLPVEEPLPGHEEWREFRPPSR